MKAKAFVSAVLIFVLYITSSQAYFNPLTAGSEQNAFVYINENKESNIPMKPISRGDVVERKEQNVRLRIMTYNMHRGIGRNGRLDLNAVADVVKNSKAEVIALQEVERHSIRTGFQDQIKQLSVNTDMSYAYGKSINVLNGEYGNGLLSKYPILEYKAYDLPSFSEQRTVLRTVLNIGSHQLAVYNVHLGLKEAERKEQIDFIMQMMETEKIDYILMGDMNTRSDKLTTITDSMKDSAVGSEKIQQSTFDEKDVSERIDYIFVSPSIAVTNYDVLISEASDHYPVISEIVVSK